MAEVKTMEPAEPFTLSVYFQAEGQSRDVPAQYKSDPRAGYHHMLIATPKPIDGYRFVLGPWPPNEMPTWSAIAAEAKEAGND